MGRLALGVAVLLFAAGCDSSGTGETNHGPGDGGTPPDGGVVVILDGGGVPATPPDGVAACPGGACNYQSGAGCPAANPVCVPLSQGGVIAPACIPGGGAGKTGSACTAQGECAAGWFCAEGLCRKLCCGGDWSGCDSASEHCIEQLQYAGPDGGGVPTGAMLCYPVGTCDALQPASCAKAGTQCLIADATGATACLPPGSGGAGDPCPCQGGFACVSAKPGEAPSCHRLCAAVAGGAPPYCQDGEGACVHHTRDPEGVGECLVLQ